MLYHPGVSTPGSLFYGKSTDYLLCRQCLFNGAAQLLEAAGFLDIPACPHGESGLPVYFGIAGGVHFDGYVSAVVKTFDVCKAGEPIFRWHVDIQEDKMRGNSFKYAHCLIRSGGTQELPLIANSFEGRLEQLMFINIIINEKNNLFHSWQFCFSLA
jgi:hypothetical protein